MGLVDTTDLTASTVLEGGYACDNLALSLQAGHFETFKHTIAANAQHAQHRNGNSFNLFTIFTMDTAINTCVYQHYLTKPGTKTPFGL